MDACAALAAVPGSITTRPFTRIRSSRRRHAAGILQWPPNAASLTPLICRVLYNVSLLQLLANLVNLRCGACADAGDLLPRVFEERRSGAADSSLQGSHLRALLNAGDLRLMHH